MKIKSSVYFIVLCLSLSSYAAKANLKNELIQACKNYQNNVKTDHINGCKLYIDGFIDSALLSEHATVKSNKEIKNNQQKSEFIKRVYQTRLSSELNADKQVSYQFCIPHEYSRKTLASDVVLALDIEALDKKEFKQVVFETLVSKFPCG